MSDEQVERTRLMMQSLESQKAERMYRQRIQSAQEVAGAVMDSRVKDPKHVIPDIVQVVLPSAESCSAITAYETQPIASALLLRAVGGQVESVKGHQVRELDVQITDMLKDEELLEILDLYDNYEPKQGDEPPALDEDQTLKFASYNDLVGERSWILDTMTDGLSPLCEQEMGLRMRILNLERKAERINEDIGDLNEEELARYGELMGRQYKKLTRTEQKDLQRYRDKGLENLTFQEAPNWEVMMEKLKEDLKDEEKVEFVDLMKRANYATLEDLKFAERSEEIVEEHGERRKMLNKQIAEKMNKLEGVNEEWMLVYKAFNGMVDNVNVTDQWRKAWHDLGAGAVGGFTETRWAEFQKMSEMKALLELPGVGPAIEVAFQAICKIGLNLVDQVPGSVNTLQMEKLTEAGLENGLINPVKNFMRKELGEGAQELYIGFGFQMARMLTENTFVAGWLGVARDQNGRVLYINNKDISAEESSVAYKYAVPAANGDGSMYVDRMNDYSKVSMTRAKVMKDFAGGYETGLPALLPVLPDCLGSPMISHADILLIANGKKKLVDVIEEKPENGRWGWAYGLFRAAQIYDIASKFIVGLKGFRNAGEEVDFFFKSPANMGGLAKKIDVALGKNSIEAIRFRMNIFMAAVYSIDSNLTNHNLDNEMKSILPGLKSAQQKTLVNYDRDEYLRIFVRNGFLTEDQFKFAYARLKNIVPEEGGKTKVGMIKKEEAGLLMPLISADTVKSRSAKLADNI